MPTIYTTENTAGSASSVGGVSAWTDPSNATANDSNNATWAASTGGELSDALQVTNFGFNIPDIAVIDGVVLNIGDMSQSGSYDIVANLRTSSTTSDNKATSSTPSASYGGSADLWGMTLTPAIVNGSDFGANFSIGDVSGGDAYISVNYVSITIYWHYDIDATPADVPVRHLYKVYDINDTFLGVLDFSKITSPFEYAHSINSIGTTLNVTYASSIDVAQNHPGYILTEDGEYLTDEDGNRLVLESDTPIAGLGTSTDPNVLIRNGNRVTITQYDYYYPNGKIRFRGQIRRVQAKITNGDNVVKFRIYSDGVDTNDLIARTIPYVYTTDQTQNTDDGTYEGIITVFDQNWSAGQTFETGSSTTNIGAITVRIKGYGSLSILLYDSVNGTLLASTSKTVDTDGAIEDVQFAFAELVSVSANTTYFFALYTTGGNFVAYKKAGNPYSSGAIYKRIYSDTSYALASGDSDLYFITASGSFDTSATFSSADPSTGMAAAAIDDYGLRGGRLYVGDNVEATGLGLSYKFIGSTIQEVIKKSLELSPSGFYYTVDLGTNEFIMKDTSETADITLTIGKHIKDLDLVFSIENMVNKYLFTGGDTGSGTNLYKEYQDTSSINTYGVRLERRTDNRVTLSATANALGNTVIAEGKDELSETTVEVLAGTMDLFTLTPGVTIGFNGSGTFIDDLIFQITRVEYSPEKARIDIGTRPPQMTSFLESLQRGLYAEQTIANPDQPS